MEYDDQGRLVITLTDGTVLDPVELPQPEVHVHTYTDWTVIKTPSCTEQGLKLRFCLGCDTVGYAFVSATGHTEVTDTAVSPTCTETGLTAGKHCSVCGEVLVAQETVDALGHTEVIDEAIEPTCTETGLTAGTHCETCGDVFVAQRVVPASGHTEVTDEAVSPTCTETGLTEGKHCSACGNVFVAQEIVDALGHTPGAEATCTTAQTCTACGVELVAALGHSLGDWQISREPTATENGEGRRDCGNCDHSELGEIIPEPFTVTCENCNQLGFDGDEEEFTIPAVFQAEDGTWYRVTGVGDEAFKDCDALVSVTIPETVTGLGYAAFSGCSSLTSIRYAGTEEQWNEISKDPEWSLGLNDYTVYYIGDLEANVNTLDFSTFAPKGENSDGTAYTDCTSPDRWTATGAMIKVDEEECNGVLNGASVIVLSGNTSNVGTLTSPTLKGGVAMISFKVAYFWKETQKIDLTLTVTAENGEALSVKVEFESPTEDEAYDYVCVLETPIEGNFTIKIVNNCPSNLAANKDRVAIWDFTWVSVEGDSSEAPDEATAD